MNHIFFSRLASRLKVCWSYSTTTSFYMLIDSSLFPSIVCFFYVNFIYNLIFSRYFLALEFRAFFFVAVIMISCERKHSIERITLINFNGVFLFLHGFDLNYKLLMMDFLRVQISYSHQPFSGES